MTGSPGRLCIESEVSRCRVLSERGGFFLVWSVFAMGTASSLHPGAV